MKVQLVIQNAFVDDDLYGAMYRCCEILRRLVAFKKAVSWSCQLKEGSLLAGLLGGFGWLSLWLGGLGLDSLRLGSPLLLGLLLWFAGSGLLRGSLLGFSCSSFLRFGFGCLVTFWFGLRDGLPHDPLGSRSRGDWFLLLLDSEATRGARSFGLDKGATVDAALQGHLDVDLETFSNLVVVFDVLADGLARRAAAFSERFDGGDDHFSVFRVGRWSGRFLLAGSSLGWHSVS